MFIERGTVAGGARVGFAHVSALFCVPVVVAPVIAGACEVINVRESVDPNHGIRQRQ